ncbi:MAG: phosphate/phosphite/phosphonate ABC transporter substrate-binding protein [bacterium]|nr:MAG: phosphate/phosphite/phosphonate ABC transporter substrate-binding protein [bacterium]
MRRSSRYPAAAVFLAVLLAAVPSAAQQPKVFRIVLVPERNIFDQEQKYRNLCDHLCSVLPVRVVFEVLQGYEEVMVEIETGTAQGAVLGSFLMAHGIARHDFIPLARPAWNTGDSFYRSYIFKRTQSPITEDVGSWKGKSFAFANRHTSAGYFFPLAVLRDQGVQRGEDHFSKVQVTGSHDTAVWVVASGLADIGAAKSTVFDEMMASRPGLADKIQVLRTGGRFPDATFVVNPRVEAEMRDALKNALLDLSTTPQGKAVLERFGASRFVPSEAGDYDDVFRVIEAAGFDIYKLPITTQDLETGR